MFAELAGKSFGTSDGRLFTYSWIEPGISLQFEAIDKKGVSYSTYFYQGEGEIRFSVPKGHKKFVSSDGVNWMLYADEKYRQRHVLFLGDYAIYAEKLKKGKWESYFAEFREPVAASQAQALRNELIAKRNRKQSDGGGFMGALSGAIMGAATGYADSGGSSVGAIAGAMGGAAVGSAGGNEAQYAYLEQRTTEETANAQSSERQLQRTIARAQNQSSGSTAAYTNSQTGNGSGSIPSAAIASGSEPTQTSSEGLTRVTRNAYFSAAMNVEAHHSRNPMCYSNEFPVTFDSSPKGWGDAGRAQEAVDVHQANFVAKCARLGKVVGPALGHVQGVHSYSTPAPYPDDYVVSLP
jgi:hypothetical protein